MQHPENCTSHFRLCMVIKGVAMHTEMLQFQFHSLILFLVIALQAVTPAHLLLTSLFLVLLYAKNVRVIQHRALKFFDSTVVLSAGCIASL